MAGAGKKRAKAERQAGQKSRDNGPSAEGKPTDFDGPSDRPGSSSGVPLQGSSRGPAPSNTPSDAPAQSARGSAQPASAGGPSSSQAGRPQARSQSRGPQLNRNVEWGGNAFDFYAQEPLVVILLLLIPSSSITNRLKALKHLVFVSTSSVRLSFAAMDVPKDPFKPDKVPSSQESVKVPGPSTTLPDGTPLQPIRQAVLDVNSYRDQMPTKLMRRPGFGTAGKPLKLQLNSHVIRSQPNARYYQYDVQIGDGKAKRGLIKAVWESVQLDNKIPGGRIDWLYDGNRLAWSRREEERDQQFLVDLDQEPNRGRKLPKLAHGKPVQLGKAAPKDPDHPESNIHKVIIRKTAQIDLNMIHAFLDGKTDFGPPVINAINFLDHLIREHPSKQHINIKKSYFDRAAGAVKDLGGGIEAMRGVYQSIRMAEGKRLVLNVDVSHTTFWRRSSFPSIVNQLSLHMDIDTLHVNWRKNMRDPTTVNEKFKTMRRLKRNKFIVEHKGRSDAESVRVHTVDDVLNIPANEYTFEITDRVTGVVTRSPNLYDYYAKKYNIHLQYPRLPVVKTTRGKKDVVFPMELCHMIPGQRYPYKLNENQTRNMIDFSVQVPYNRLEGIAEGTKMLAWDQDPYLIKYGLKIDKDPITTNARLLQPPIIQMNRDTINPGTRGSWDLRGKKFLEKNPLPLIYWGVCMMSAPGYQKTAQKPQVEMFVQKFVSVYESHGGVVHTKKPKIYGPFPDPAKAVEDTFTAVGNEFQVRPQFLLFVLPNASAEVYLRIKKSADCRYGVYTQCVQGKQVVKNDPQYLSNVCMKVNAKLGGTTSRAINLLVSEDDSPKKCALTATIEQEGRRLFQSAHNGHRL
ncbi:MAG: hypothetical protein Q9179_005141 [Wetmoreana sp. 5 TL-2023]